MEKPVFTLRPAKPGDERQLRLIRGIASYEHLEDQVVNTPEKDAQISVLEESCFLLR